MNVLRFPVGATLWLLLAGTVAALAEEPPPESWVNFLRSRKDRIPRCSVEWQVTHRVAANTAHVLAIEKDIDAQLKITTDREERAKLEKIRAALVDDAKKDKIIPISVKLDYYTMDRFYLSVTYRYESPQEDEYYANGDGRTYAVQERLNRVRILSGTAAVLGEWARGLPEFLLSDQLNDIKTMKPGPEFADRMKLESEVNTLTVWIQKPSRRIQSLRITGTDLDTELDTQSYREDLDYPMTTQVDVKTFDFFHHWQTMDTWKLVRVQLRPDPSQQHSPQYEFKRGYTVIDETEEKKREYKSDEVLGKGKS